MDRMMWVIKGTIQKLMYFAGFDVKIQCQKAVSGFSVCFKIQKKVFAYESGRVKKRRIKES